MAQHFEVAKVSLLDTIKGISTEAGSFDTRHASQPEAVRETFVDADASPLEGVAARENVRMAGEEDKSRKTFGSSIRDNLGRLLNPDTRTKAGFGGIASFAIGLGAFLALVAFATGVTVGQEVVGDFASSIGVDPSSPLGWGMKILFIIASAGAGFATGFSVVQIIATLVAAGALLVGIFKSIGRRMM